MMQLIYSQEIQIPTAGPHLSLRPPREVEESSEWILLIHNRHCIYMMQLNYFHCIPVETSQEIKIPMDEPQLSLRPPREVEKSSEWIFAHPQHVARYIAGITYMMQLIYFHCMPLETLQYDFLPLFQWDINISYFNPIMRFYKTDCLWQEYIVVCYYVDTMVITYVFVSSHLCSTVFL